jgi:hypothetical protein
MPAGPRLPHSDIALKGISHQNVTYVTYLVSRACNAFPNNSLDSKLTSTNSPRTMESAPEPTPPLNTTRKCKKDGCKNRIPLDSRCVTCDHCRAINRKNQRDSRARAATSAKESTNNGLLPKKRRRDSLGAADGRPATRSRTDHPDNSTSNARGDAGEERSDDEMCGDGNSDVHLLKYTRSTVINVGVVHADVLRC